AISARVNSSATRARASIDPFRAAERIALLDADALAHATQPVTRRKTGSDEDRQRKNEEPAFHHELNKENAPNEAGEPQREARAADPCALARPVRAAHFPERENRPWDRADEEEDDDEAAHQFLT